MQYWIYSEIFAILLLLVALLTGCGRNTAVGQNSSSRAETGWDAIEQGQDAVKESTDTEVSANVLENNIETSYTPDTKVWDVIDDPTFEGYGRLIFPVDKTIDKNMTLSEVDSILTWYNYVNSDRTVEIVNYMKTNAEAGKQIFYDIYTNEEKPLILRKRIQDFSFSEGIRERNLPL